MDAMQVELTERGLRCETESQIKGCFKKSVVGVFYSDLFVNESIIVELNISIQYNSAGEVQLLNELKATGIKVGLPINFGKVKVEFKRLVT